MNGIADRLLELDGAIARQEHNRDVRLVDLGRVGHYRSDGIRVSGPSCVASLADDDRCPR